MAEAKPTRTHKGRRSGNAGRLRRLVRRRRKRAPLAGRRDGRRRDLGRDETDERYEQIKQSGDTHIAELQRMSMAELIEEARKENLTDYAGIKKQDLIFKILKERVKLNGLMYGEGTLEVLPDGFGFLRSPDYHYLSCPDDIYVSPSQIRRFGLRTGATVSGPDPPAQGERALLRPAARRGDQLPGPEPAGREGLLRRPDAAAPRQADRAWRPTPTRSSMRVVDLIVPIGFGQRGLIVSPPRAGKTILMQKMAKAVLTNYPDLYVFMLLIDERPEEVTDMERQVKGPNCEVISSTFDEPAARHIQVSEMVLEKAKRMVEYGHDVLIFLDSITRLARAWNAECPHSGKILSGGVDANALQRPKRFFGSARKVEEGGSLTIIATALVDTGSSMDEVIFEEFKGTGNLEIVLDRKLVDKRIWPAIDINRSGTRREEMLLDPEEYRRVCILRRVLNDMNPPDAMELLVAPPAKDQDQRRVPDEHEELKLKAERGRRKAEERRAGTEKGGASCEWSSCEIERRRLLCASSDCRRVCRNSDPVKCLGIKFCALEPALPPICARHRERARIWSSYPSLELLSRSWTRQCSGSNCSLKASSSPQQKCPICTPRPTNSCGSSFRQSRLSNDVSS